MLIKKKLPSNVVDALSVALSELSLFVEEQNEARDDKSDKWLESDAGTNHEAWLDELASVIDALENAMHEMPE